MARTKKLSKKQFEEKVKQIVAYMESETKPFSDSSEEAKNKRLNRAKKDPEYFKTTYLPHYFYKPSGKIHKELDEMANAGKKSLFAVAFPREHGKSTHLTFATAIHQACFQISPYTIIISDTIDLASEFIRFIKLEFETNPRIRQDFGDLVTKGAWSDTDIIIGNRARIRGLGSGMKIRGTKFRQWRPTLILGDDIENNINVRNKKLVRRKLNWIIGAVYNSLSDDGVMIIIGTMLEKISVLALLVDHINEKAEAIEKKFGITGRLKAVVYGALDDQGQPVWPEGKSLQKLLVIKETVGPMVWASEYMNQPLDTGIYKLDWFQDYKRDIVFQIPRAWAYFSGSDPSARSGENRDFKAHVVLAKDMDTKLLYTVHAWIKHASIHEMNQAFLELYREYRMVASGYEVNGFQMQIKEDLEEMMFGQGLFPNIQEITHTQDKVLRISRLAAAVQKKRILFDQSDSDQELLIEQIHAIGSNACDDGADAWEMAAWCAENWGGTFNCKTTAPFKRGRTKRQMIVIRRHSFTRKLRREYKGMLAA